MTVARRSTSRTRGTGRGAKRTNSSEVTSRSMDTLRCVWDVAPSSAEWLRSLRETCRIQMEQLLHGSEKGVRRKISSDQRIHQKLAGKLEETDKKRAKLQTESGSAGLAVAPIAVGFTSGSAPGGIEHRLDDEEDIYFLIRAIHNKWWHSPLQRQKTLHAPRCCHSVPGHSGLQTS